MARGIQWRFWLSLRIPGVDIAHWSRGHLTTYHIIKSTGSLKLLSAVADS